MSNYQDEAGWADFVFGPKGPVFRPQPMSDKEYQDMLDSDPVDICEDDDDE